jgi:hypothetical protein
VVVSGVVVSENPHNLRHRPWHRDFTGAQQWHPIKAHLTRRSSRKISIQVWCDGEDARHKIRRRKAIALHQFSKQFTGGSAYLASVVGLN